MLAGIRLEALPAGSLIDAALALMAQHEVCETEVHKARNKMFAMIASLPAEAAQARETALREQTGTEVDLSPVTGLDEAPMGVI